MRSSGCDGMDLSCDRLTGGGHRCRTTGASLPSRGSGFWLLYPSRSPPYQARASESQAGFVGSASGQAAQGTRKPPITATGFVESGPVPFEDVTKVAGLSGWKHTMGNADKRLIIDTNGSGVGLIDYDNDGWLDIYMVNGSTFKAIRPDLATEPAPGTDLEPTREMPPRPTGRARRNRA